MNNRGVNAQGVLIGILIMLVGLMVMTSFPNFIWNWFYGGSAWGYTTIAHFWYIVLKIIAVGMIGFGIWVAYESIKE